jgi:tRNA(Arg) A34 adenosine deaminase TadA
MTASFSDSDHLFMNLALQEALQASTRGNYPVGAVLVVDGLLIAREHNKKENKADRISHAEMLLFLRLDFGHLMIEQHQQTTSAITHAESFWR